MSHAFSGLLGGGKSSPTIYIAPSTAPTLSQSVQPTIAPTAPSASSPGGGAQTPSFLGGAVLPPSPGGGQSRGKALLGS